MRRHARRKGQLKRARTPCSLAALTRSTRARLWGARSQGEGVAWYRLTDLVRATIQYADIDALYEGLRLVVAELDVQEFNDRYQVPLGEYRDIQLVVCFEDHMCELQLSTGARARACSLQATPCSSDE